MDDDFSSTTLDPKWTLVSGSVGTVDLNTTTCTTPIYDLTSVPDFLALQVENNQVSLRQDYELPDGKSVILKLHPALNASSNLAGEIDVGICLNSDDASYWTYSTIGKMLMCFDANADGWRIYAEARGASNTLLGATGIGDPGEESPFNGGQVYLRISREGLNYRWFASFNGVSWVPMNTAITRTAAFNNIWIFAASAVATGSKTLPVQLIDWIKEVNNTVFDVR
jgi:hypothetical protein